MAIKCLKTGEVTYEGKVIFVADKYRGFDHYQDYARVWTGSGYLDVEIGTGYCDQTHKTHSASVDATDAVKAEIKAWEAEQARISAEYWAKQQAEEKERKRQELNALQNKLDATPDRGVAIVITTGRLKKTKKLSKGDTGVVFWKGVNKFDPNKISVGIELKDGRKVFVDSDYVALDFVEFINQGS